MTVSPDHLNSLVNWSEGQISPEIFIDPDIYRVEMEKVFGRTWLFLAHDSMIPKPHDFFATYMGWESSPAPSRWTVRHGRVPGARCRFSATIPVFPMRGRVPGSTCGRCG
jgi:hypothetical protein